MRSPLKSWTVQLKKMPHSSLEKKTQQVSNVAAFHPLCSCFPAAFYVKETLAVWKIRIEWTCPHSPRIHLPFTCRRIPHFSPYLSFSSDVLIVRCVYRPWPRALCFIDNTDWSQQWAHCALWGIHCIQPTTSTCLTCLHVVSHCVIHLSHFPFTFSLTMHTLWQKHKQWVRILQKIYSTHSLSCTSIEWPLFPFLCIVNYSIFTRP